MKEETNTEILLATVLTMLKIAAVLFAVFTMLSIVSIDHRPPIDQFNYPQQDN